MVHDVLVTKHHIVRTPGSSLEERETYWENIIEKARAYPGGITAFCKAYHVRKQNYYQWFKRLKLKHPEWEPLAVVRRQSKDQTEAANFVPVIVTDGAPSSEALPRLKRGKPSMPRAPHPVTLELRSSAGHIVTLPATEEFVRLVLEEVFKPSD